MTNNFSNDVYRSTKTVAYLAIAGFSLICLAEILSIVFGIGQIVSPALSFGGEPGWIILQTLASLMQFPCMIFTIVCFLVWLNRSNKNLTPLRAGNIEFSSGWAVGWWFIPFANLIKPFQVVREVWKESDPEVDPEMNFLSASVETPSLLTFWWAFWIISNVAANISSRAFEAKDLAALEFSGYIFIASGFFTTVAAVLAIKVVLGITQRQEERFHKLGSFGRYFQSPPPPPEF